MRRNGFTILEILVVLAVLTVIIGIAVPRIKGVQDQSAFAQVKSELNMIQLALETYYTNHRPNAYPATEGDEAVIFHITEKVLMAENPPSIAGIMVDPFGLPSTPEYFYQNSDNVKYYVVGSLGTFKWEDENDTRNRIKDGFRIQDDGTLSGEALDFISQGMICVTNGSGC